MTKTSDRLVEGAKTVTKIAGAAKAADAAKSVTHLSVPAKAGLGILGILQLAFAFLAFWDLAWRDEDEVRGPKPAWIPAILMNWIGPAAYFLVGIRHRR